MPFPLSFSGRIELSPLGPEPLTQASVQGACDAMALGLRARGAYGIQVDGATIRFKSHPWAGFGWGLARLVEMLKAPRRKFGPNLLPVVSTGTLGVREEGGKLRVSYTVRLTYVLLLATIGMAWMAAWMGYCKWEGAFAKPFIPIGWIWLVGGNYVVSYLRFDKFVRNLASATP
jgi:hypothetical protein